MQGFIGGKHVGFTWPYLSIFGHNVPGAVVSVGISKTEVPLAYRQYITIVILTMGLLSPKQARVLHFGKL